jgi:predicted dehydrogenase
MRSDTKFSSALPFQPAWKAPSPPNADYRPLTCNSESVGLPVAELSEDPYTSEIRHAYDAIGTESPFEVTAVDALEALRISLAVRDSLTTGQAVSIGP